MLRERIPKDLMSFEEGEKKEKKTLKERIKDAGEFFYRLFYIVKLVWEAKPWILAVLAALCLLSGLLPVASALLSRDLLNEISVVIQDDAIREKLGVTIVDFLSACVDELRPVFILLITYVLVHFFQNLVASINNMAISIASEYVINHIKLKIMNKAKDIDLADFDRPEFYEKLENANREAGGRPLQIISATFSIVSSLISTVSYIIILAVLHPLAPMVMILLGIPTMIINQRYRKKSFGYIRHHSKERRQMTYFSTVLTEKDYAKEVRMMGLSDTLVGKYNTAFAKYFKGLKSLIIRERLWHILFDFISFLARCAIFMYVAYSVIYKNGLVGDYTLYTGALSTIVDRITTIITNTATIYEGTLFIDNMISFMDRDVTIKPTVSPALIPEKNGHHEIEFKNVSFRYPGTNRDVIKNVSFKINSGEQVVLVGLNGAGKTTLIKLLTRLYDPTEGVITLDGRDIREYDVKELYDMFGIIFQDFVKYAVSVGENIAFGDVKVPYSEERVRDAAERADASSYIEKLPDGYSTPLMRIFESNGLDLSIGQWQKLSIARAYYKESEILILDEPTAALDPIAEQQIFNKFTELGKNKITVFVSHRLSSAVSASKIIVIDGGELVEMGDHNTLMEKGGKYHMLFTTQAQRYLESKEEQEQ